MSKYQRWQRVERPEPLWLAERQGERARSLRPVVSGLCCEECAEPVPQRHFLSFDGLCARCFEMLHALLLDGGSSGLSVAVLISVAGEDENADDA